MFQVPAPTAADTAAAAISTPPRTTQMSSLLNVDSRAQVRCAPPNPEPPW